MAKKKVDPDNLRTLLENDSLSSDAKVVFLLTLLAEGEVTKDPYLRKCGLDEFSLHEAWRTLRLCDFKATAFRKEFRFQGDNFLFPERKRGAKAPAQKEGEENGSE